MLMPSIETLLPHAGRMRLIDRVVSYDEQTIVCESDSHRAADHPLAEAGVLSIVCGLEYGAQAMAIHGALLGKRGSPGAPSVTDFWSLRPTCGGPSSGSINAQRRS